MALGIENSISDTAKAFQGNPAALQQRYAQKQDLFDLLALNMIRKEQDAAKRGLLLSQQQMPGTILEQMEGAVTKNVAETAEGVKGALDTKNAQSKANMSKMAGVSGAPAGNMRTLAGGGVVGFAAGKEVEGSVTDEILKKINISRKDFESLPKETQDTLVSSIAATTSDDDSELSRDIDSFLGPKERRRIIQNAADKAVTEAPGFFSQAGEYIFGDKESYQNVLDQRAKAEERKKYLTNLANTKESQFAPKTTGIDEKLIEEQKRMQQGQLSGLASLQKPDVKPTTDEKNVKPVVPVDNFAGDKSGGVAASPAFDASKYAMDGAFNKQVKGGIGDLINQDPQKAVDFAARTPSEQAFIAKMLQERTDMRANMMDPDKLSNDRLMQTLLGAKGATAGEAFRTSGLAGINAERSQEKLKRDEFDALNKLYMTEADRSQTIKKDAFKDSLAAKKQGVASGTSLTTSEKTAALEADKLVQKISNDKIANSLRGDLNTIQKQRNSIMATGNTVKSNTQVIKLYKDTETKQILAAQKVYEAEKKNNLLKPAKERADLDRKAKERMDADIAQIRKTIALESKPFEDSLKSLSTQTGGANTGGFTVKKKS